ncbi:MAG: hypothetical protein IJD43_14190 [Thermoguttaceae bacterium]|nr:hypothetical protein [Planctomycetaceae bacterium]MBQ4144614.1 hypothetical protein [Thermoguttaceae bacterium]
MTFNLKKFGLALAACLFFHTAVSVSAEDLTPWLVTEKDGPWFVSVCTFANPDPKIAADQAVALVKELRQDFRLQAYIYVKESGEGNTTEGRPYYVVDPENPEAAPRISTTYTYMTPSMTHEFAVLVGNFTSVEDPRAQRALQTIRPLCPKCMSGNDSVHPMISQDKNAPLSRAFITSNPLLSREHFVSAGLDPVVLAANQDIKRYSLLDCPGKYTVQVAVLKGVTTLNQQRIAEIKANDARGLSIKGQTLSEADEKAVKLCDALRAKGIEAYVFRDRYASIVTVGSFDFVGEEVNGQFQFRPEILSVIQQFSPSIDPNQSGVASIKRKTLRDIPGRPAKKEVEGIMFDLSPRVVQVPRRPVLN